MKSATPSLAIVGMACVFPDARTPVELWENVLAQRRAFRHLPSERLRTEDYGSADPQAPDRSYVMEGAVIEGYEFDRVAFRVVGSTFRSADLTHWLALDVAARALADAGFPEGRGLPRTSTGVMLGNTLTGEFARAGLLRLRWPYVRRVLAAALTREGWPAGKQHEFLEQLESDYKSPFPEVGEESLAGGLSNTIAGRICNQFDFKGGGYTVDGACASSLLAVANACAALTTGDLDVALAGGVDLSLDPFEIVGFAKTGALAADEMRVFDRRSAGFWPGEGCGFVVLMREPDALAQGCRIYATIRGWGVSSDGQGGITRPEAEGQLEALRRAYRRAGFGMDTVAYCEGHGTGTAVGDATELEVLSRGRREANVQAPPAAIGSIKANIGHTKAAAGIAGLIKATMAVHTQVLPPTTGCEQPHAQLTGPSPALRVPGQAEPWPQGRPLRASVSGMGFGGINAHLVLEGNAVTQRSALSPRELALSRSQQDTELFFFAAETAASLAQQVDTVLLLAERLSRAELGDLAARLQKELGGIAQSRVRAAVVAAKPAELAARLRTLRSWLEAGKTPPFQSAEGVFLGAGSDEPRIGFLFTGQGAPTHLDGGAWRRRFHSVDALYARAALPVQADSVSTRVAQPAVVTASLAGLTVLAEFGLRAHAAIGHSLGEITALHWAGAFSADALLRIARLRGAAMADLGSPTGAMLALSIPWQKAQVMLKADPLTIVGYNSPRQTVVAGDATAIHRLAERARALDCQATVLPVSHAFHTPLVGAAVPALAAQLGREDFLPLRHTVFSTITGGALETDTDLRELLCRQVTSPVRFESALGALLGLDVGTDFYQRAPVRPTSGVDLLIEVGPGEILTGLVRDAAEVPVLALDAGGRSLRGLLQALGAAFALGAPVRHDALFADRFVRAFDLDWKPKFFANPCELAPVAAEGLRLVELADEPARRATARGEPVVAPPDLRTDLGVGTPEPTIDLVRKRVAERAELPPASVQDAHRMLNDLHLNSITVGQIVSDAARQLGLPRVSGLTEFANASVEEIARALDELKKTGPGRKATDPKRQPPGVDIWIETFTVELVATRPPRRRGKAASAKARTSGAAGWEVFAPPAHPLAQSVHEKLAAAGGSGVALCLPEHPNEDHIALMLEAARAVMAMKPEPRFLLVQHGWGGGGFARTLHLETPGLTTCVVNVPPGCPQAADWVTAETASAGGYTEAHYDREGQRSEPRLQWRPPGCEMEQLESSSSSSSTPRPRTKAEDDYPIGPDDVLLVTGGGKGIAAECALALARATGVRLALLGRSDPGTDRELADNLARIQTAGARCCYARADVTDERAVAAAVAEAEQQLGAVTAWLHAAGTNMPRLIGALDEAAFRRTLAPKLQGARHVLAAVNPDRLKLLITFGSIIARAGLPGEADYATANEWMTAFTEAFQARHPRCRCLALEWSVWSGAGMGERLGRMESLIQQGIMPIPVDEGVRILLEAVRRPGAAVAQVIAGRFGEPPTLKLRSQELPLRRFLERRRVSYPGVELLVDAELSVAADPYLNDHVVQKQRLFPAVLGLEAMAQAAMALTGSDAPPSFEDVELSRPVVVPAEGIATIRLAALRRGPDVVEVCLRAEETDFHVDHFRALCRFTVPSPESPGQSPTGRLKTLDSGLPAQERLFQDPGAADASPLHSPTKQSGLTSAATARSGELLPLDPLTELYGRIFFHEGRFRRVRGYQLLKAKECVAEILPDSGASWFGPYLPGELVLGDPGARDAALHAIQACIPHRRILPTGIGRLTMYRQATGPCFVHARERLRAGDTFTYDFEVTDAAGEVLETWEGLRLRAVEVLPVPATWPEALLAPYVERRLEELLPGVPVKVALQRTGAMRRREVSDAVLQSVLGRTAKVQRRPDGKPESSDGAGVSLSHAEDFTLAVAGDAGVACDVEPIVARTESAWRDLLGDERLKLAERICREHAEPLDAAATRLWTVAECLKKAGWPPEAPLVLASATSDGWLGFRSGALAIAVGRVAVGGSDLALAVATRSHRAEAHQPALAAAVA